MVLFGARRLLKQQATAFIRHFIFFVAFHFLFLFQPSMAESGWVDAYLGLGIGGSTGNDARQLQSKRSVYTFDSTGELFRVNFHSRLNEQSTQHVSFCHYLLCFTYTTLPLLSHYLLRCPILTEHQTILLRFSLFSADTRIVQWPFCRFFRICSEWGFVDFIVLKQDQREVESTMQAPWFSTLIHLLYVHLIEPKSPDIWLIQVTLIFQIPDKWVIGIPEISIPRIFVWFI